MNSPAHLFPRKPLAVAFYILAASMGSQSAVAQNQETADTKPIEEVLITGTRIKGLDLKGAVQAIQLDREAILDSGTNDLGQLMQDLTVTGGGGGTFSTSTAGALSGDTPAGASSVSMRNLGVGTSLTLINSRRASVSSFASGQASFIDINSIPQAAVDRIEITPTGSSALYGADAVAGVVNFILRDDYDGFELSGSYGDSTASSDEGEYNLSMLWGGGNDQHRFMAIVDYFERNALNDRERDFSAESVRPSQQGFFPSFNDLFFMTFDQTEEPGDGGCAADDFGFGNFGEFCEVNNNQFTAVQDDYESIGGMLTYNFKISESAEWFNEFIYQRTESQGTSSPANFSRAPVDPESPLWPSALIEDMEEEGSFGGLSEFSDFYGFPIYAWGKFTEPRAVERESETLRLVSGISLDLSNDWNLETAATYGRNESEQRGLSGLFVSEAFYNANLGNLCTDGTQVERWDVDLTRPDASFVGDTCEDAGKTTLWYNPFGGQASQQAGIDELVRTQAERSGESELFMLDATLSGALFEFNGNTVSSAIGAEWRRETLKDTPSGVAVATTFNPEPILGFSSTSADAERDQWAVFAEFYVPLTDELDLRVAGRYDHYDTFGGDFNPMVALRFQPAKSIAFRGNYSTSFRAPALAQVGAGTLLSSYNVDCVATPEACAGDPSADGQSLFSEDVANDNLEAETADTWGGGIVFTPTEDIDLTLDYWRIEYEDVIGVDEDDFIRRALGGEYAVVAPGELPTGVPGLEVQDGFVADAHFELTNLGFEDVSGVDLSYTHYIDVGPGTLSLLADVTYYIEYERQASDASPIIDEIGEFTFPQWLANAKVRYSWSDWRASFGMRHTDGYRDDPSSRTLEAVGLPANAMVDVDAWTVFDLSLRWEPTSNGSLLLTVRNVFDEDPPRVLGFSSNVDQINHFSMGRFATLRYTHSF